MTQTNDADIDPAPPRTRPGQFVKPVIARLQEEHLNESASARAVLAQLRRAAGGEPGTAWDVSAYLIPEVGVARSDHDEAAIHVAVTTYAWLQQSNRSRMHVSGRSLGEAARRLAEDPNENMDRDKVWGRLAKLAQAESLSSLTWQLRSFASLLRRREIGLDVALLADDLYFWQHPATKARVQRDWSRAFFRRGRTSSDS